MSGGRRRGLREEPSAGRDVSLAARPLERTIAPRIDVWSQGLDVNEEACTRLTALLSCGERQHAQQFHRAIDRRRYCVRRGILREVLAHYLSCGPRDVPIAHTEFGKPYVEDSDVTFSLSHSRGLALYAFARGRQIGCDIEWQDRRFAKQRTADLVLSKVEMEAWQALPDRQRTNAFFHYWTCKEAYLKAVGIGLGLPPRDITVSLTGTRRFVALPGANAAGWSLASVDAQLGYAAAVAICGPVPIVHLNEFGTSCPDIPIAETISISARTP